MQAIFGGVIAVLLLGLYVHFIRIASLIVHCGLVKAAACTPSPCSPTRWRRPYPRSGVSCQRS